MMWIARLALKRPYTFVATAALIVVLGILSILKMPVDVLPVVDIPIVSVIWQYTGLSAEEMEKRIVTPTERGQGGGGGNGGGQPGKAPPDLGAQYGGSLSGGRGRQGQAAGRDSSARGSSLAGNRASDEPMNSAPRLPAHARTQNPVYYRSMIALLRGIVAKSATGTIVLDVNGVGYKVFVPVSVLEQLPADNAPITLEIHTQIREDDISLFGFFDEIDRRVFELLLTVTGVGPKAALALLSGMTAQQLAQYLSTDDVRAITRVPGIGPKTAQRMVLELKEKMAALGFERVVDKIVAGGAVRAKRDEKAELLEDVSSALQNLGYNKAEAARAAEGALTEKTGDAGAGAPLPKFADLLRAALNRLTRG